MGREDLARDDQGRIVLQADEFVNLWKSHDKARLSMYGVEVIPSKINWKSDVKVFDNFRIVGYPFVADNEKVPYDLELGPNTELFHLEIKGMIKDLIVEGNCESIRFLGRSEARELRVNGRVNRLFVGEDSVVKEIVINGGWVGSLTIAGEVSQLAMFGATDSASLGGAIGSLTILTENQIDYCHISSRSKTINVSNSRINNLFLGHDLREDCFFTILKCSINKLTISQINLRNDNYFSIKKSVINGLFFEDSLLSGNIEFSDIRSDLNSFDDEISGVSIIGTDLGNSRFIDFDLSSYSTFVFKGSRILGAFISKVSFPKLDSFSESEGVSAYEQKQIYFGQINKVYETQGDTALAIKAQALELEAYRQSLERQGQEERRRRKFTIPTRKEISLRENFKDLLVLNINRLSSYYGTDWLRASMVTLACVGVLYSLYLLALGYQLGTDVNKFWEMASHALGYLNPLRNEDTGQLFEVIEADKESGYLGVRDSVITPFARTIDYVSRIIIAFMVYQTIAAFRRLGKSGS